MANRTNKRARGRPKQPGAADTQHYDLLLEPMTAEWGKEQPGGLSALVRGLLREAYEKATAAGKAKGKD